MKFNYKNRHFDIQGATEDDHILRAIIKNRCFYEIDLLEYMLLIKDHFCEPGTVAIDVGANIGNHSIYFQSFLASHVICVEPNPAVLPVLRTNLENNIEHYTLYENGLGEAAGKASVALPEGSENNVGMAKLEPGQSGEIDIITLDSMLANWREKHGSTARVSLLKVDVEGMELPVLKGATATLASDKPELFLEAATPAEFEKLNTFLGQFGYESLSRWAATPVYHFSVDPDDAFKAAVKKTRGSFWRRKLKRKILRSWYKLTKARS